MTGVQTCALPISFGQHARLVLHPEDAALVRTHLGPQLEAANCALTEDAALARGGCRVETDGAEVDATMETRWSRVVAALGASDEWLR